MFIGVVDEALIGYQPSAKTKTKATQDGVPIPVQHIPRKPHPNGLLVYLMCSWIANPGAADTSYLNKLPYVLGFHPHLKVADAAPHTVILDFLEEYVDAAVY